MKGLPAALATLFVVAWTEAVSAQVEVLTQEMIAKLEPSKEKPLTLAPNGDLVRFLSDDGEWQDAAEPLVLDINRDGVRDFVVLSMLDVQTMRRAMIIHDWGDAPGVFGNAVFYLILDAEGNVVEWAGQHQLIPRGGPERGERSPPGRPPQP